MIPAMTTGIMSDAEISKIRSHFMYMNQISVLLTMRSGRRTPIAAIPTPDLAVPYEAPRQVKTMALVQPMTPKKGCEAVSTLEQIFQVDDSSSIVATGRLIDNRSFVAGLQAGEEY